MTGGVKHITGNYRAILKCSLAFLLTALTAWVQAQAIQSREYEIKAIFLYHFTKFVEWPATSFRNAEAPFVIGILGNDPFGSFLDKTVAGEDFNGRPIKIQRYKRVEDIEHCQMLYLNIKADAALIKETIQQLPQKLLTVSDHPDFSALGGMIRLTKKDDKVKMVINPVAAKAQDLIISSKLLNLAEIFSASRK